MSNKSLNLDEIFEQIKKRDPNQDEFLQATKELLYNLEPLFKKEPKYLQIIPTLCEPERIIQFRVPWIDDKGQCQVNRAWRVQFNEALGPYKGGLRFHPSVNESVLKFLAFEQVFKNALTMLPLGGGKGGSDFDPKKKSNGEILRFCQSLMVELFKHIGPDIDVPAGDIGVGLNEIGYLYGYWKRLTNRHNGALTGKGYSWGGSLIRPEATGYGVVYITQRALKDCKQEIKDLKFALSGAGNVAIHTGKKLLELNGIIISMSDSNGCVIEKDGFTKENFEKLIKIKEKKGKIKEYTKISKSAKYYGKASPWQYVECDVAIPCATQNEVDEKDAQTLIKNGCKYFVEASNMPCNDKAIQILKKNCQFFLPAKAANAGGVAVSGLEMAQDSQRQYWDADKVNDLLQEIMVKIYEDIKENAEKFGYKNDFQFGANVTSFQKVANAMFEQGMVLDNENA